MACGPHADKNIGNDHAYGPWLNDDTGVKLNQPQSGLRYPKVSSFIEVNDRHILHRSRICNLVNCLAGFRKVDVIDASGSCPVDICCFHPDAIIAISGAHFII